MDRWEGRKEREEEGREGGGEGDEGTFAKRPQRGVRGRRDTEKQTRKDKARCIGGEQSVKERQTYQKTQS